MIEVNLRIDGAREPDFGRPIPGHPGLLAAEDGQLFTHWRATPGAGLANRSALTLDVAATPRAMFGWIDGSGCRTVVLPKGRSSGSAQTERAHVLMARAWLGAPPSPRHQVRHLNGHPADNRLSNLAWGTQKDNEADKRAHGRIQTGDAHWAKRMPERIMVGTDRWNATLTPAKVRRIRSLAGKGFTYQAIAITIGCSRGVARGVLRGETWRHVK